LDGPQGFEKPPHSQLWLIDTGIICASHRLTSGPLVASIDRLTKKIKYAPLVKICGLSTPEALDAALDAGADMVASCSSRRRRATSGSGWRASSASACAPGPPKVALTVDAGDDELARIVEALAPDMLQLHWPRVPPTRVVTVRSRFGLPVMKRCRSPGGRFLADLRLAEVADWLLVRRPCAAAPPAGPAGWAGPFDWRLLENLTPSLSFSSQAASMRQRGRGAGGSAGARGRRLQRGGARAGREGSGEDSRLHIQAARAATAALGPMGPRNPRQDILRPRISVRKTIHPRISGRRKNAGTV